MTGRALVMRVRQRGRGPGAQLAVRGGGGGGAAPHPSWVVAAAQLPPRGWWVDGLQLPSLQAPLPPHAVPIVRAGDLCWTDESGDGELLLAARFDFELPAAERAAAETKWKVGVGGG